MKQVIILVLSLMTLGLFGQERQKWIQYNGEEFGAPRSLPPMRDVCGACPERESELNKKGWYKVNELNNQEVARTLESYEKPIGIAELDTITNTVTYTWTKDTMPLNEYKNLVKGVLDQKFQLAQVQLDDDIIGNRQIVELLYLLVQGHTRQSNSQLNNFALRVDRFIEKRDRAAQAYALVQSATTHEQVETVFNLAVGL